MNQRNADEYWRTVKFVASVRHLMKCKRGARCPFNPCGTESGKAKKRTTKTVETFVNSPLYRHCVKCRETNRPQCCVRKDWNRCVYVETSGHLCKRWVRHISQHHKCSCSYWLRVMFRTKICWGLTHIPKACFSSEMQHCASRGNGGLIYKRVTLTT